MSNHMGISGGAAGGRGGAGGGMLKTFTRAVTATAANFRHRKPPLSLLPPPPPPVSSSSITGAAASGHNLRKVSVFAVSSSGSLSDPLSPSSPASLARPLLSAGDSAGFRGEEFDWVKVDRGDGDVLKDDTPTADEVQDAFSALQLAFDVEMNPNVEDRVLQPAVAISSSVLSSASDLDWTEPPLHLCNPRVLQLQPYLYDRFFDAFHLFQTEPSIQRMVVSLASDRAVWDAVMNNKVVRELITNVECDNPESLEENPRDLGSAAKFVKELFAGSKARIVDVIERITKYVTDLFNIPGDDKATSVVAGAAPVVEKLQMTVLLSVVVLLIVVVTRVTRA